jgi:arginine decarboxylase
MPGDSGYNAIMDQVVEYLRSGLKAGTVLPDPADPSLDTFRVAVEAPQ